MIDGSGVSYKPGDSFRTNEDTILYAIWQRKIENIIRLPSALTAIESEAFIGTDADAIVVPDTVVSIGTNAFDDVVIYGYAGSYAETYAKENDLTFYPITELEGQE